MASNPVLSVNNLSLELKSGRGATSLVNNVSFKIPQRRVLGLIGESGCGKSLTCLAIMGLLPANIHQSGGEVFIDGRPMSGLKPAERRAIRGKTAAMVLQNPMSCFDSVFSIRHHFKETLASHGNSNSREVERRSLAALSEVGFEDPKSILDLYPFQMSGGMLQRVMMALAVMMDVSLLIADEPTTDLDVVSQARVLELLAEIRDGHGLSLLLVTHDLSVIAKLADEVAVMRAGSIVESGPVGKIFSSAAHPYTQALLKAHDSLYGPGLNRLLSTTTPGKQAADTGIRA